MTILGGNPAGGARVRVDLEDGAIIHRVSGEKATQARVVIRRDTISVGCTDTTIHVLERLVSEYRKRFPIDDAFVIQEGTK